MFLANAANKSSKTSDKEKGEKSDSDSDINSSEESNEESEESSEEESEESEDPGEPENDGKSGPSEIFKGFTNSGAKMFKSVGDTLESSAKVVGTIGEQVWDAIFQDTCDDQVKEAISFVLLLFKTMDVHRKTFNAWSIGKPVSLVLAMMMRLHHYTLQKRLYEQVG